MNSTWFNYKSLPESYVFPPEERPGKLNFPLEKAIPVVDLCCQDRSEVVQQILQACKEFGVFQVINHGVPTTLMDETMRVYKEFHSMPAEERASQCSKDPAKSCKFFTGNPRYQTEKYHLWRDALFHPCHPSDQDCIKFWPDKIFNKREVVAEYAEKVNNLGTRILQLISEGLGLSSGHFEGELAEQQYILANHYPRCPDPSLTLGVRKHRDSIVIILLHQDDTQGYQVFKDQEWFDVELPPHSFLVNVGHLLRVISNGKLIAVEHRVVTNSRRDRTTIASSFRPSNDCIVEPAKCLIDERNPPMYRSFVYKDFFAANFANPDGIEEFIKPTPKDD